MAENTEKSPEYKQTYEPSEFVNTPKIDHSFSSFESDLENKKDDSSDKSKSEAIKPISELKNFTVCAEMVSTVIKGHEELKRLQE